MPDDGIIIVISMSGSSQIVHAMSYPKILCMFIGIRHSFLPRLCYKTQMWYNDAKSLSCRVKLTSCVQTQSFMYKISKETHSQEEYSEEF